MEKLEFAKSSIYYKLLINGGIKTLPIVEKYRNLFYDKNKNKKIPLEILNSPKNIRENFFQGYYDGDGLKTRLVFCEISLQNPHLLLFDEPTNAADMEMIDSMAEAIKAFNGGVIVISHDFRLLQQIAEEIWVIDRGLKVWDGDIRSYKASLKKKFGYKK